MLGGLHSLAPELFLYQFYLVKFYKNRSISSEKHFSGGGWPGWEAGGLARKTDNVSRFLHMRGPLVPNFIEIGQLVQ